MAAFIAKQMVGNKLKSVQGALGDDEKKDDAADNPEGEDPEVLEARREAEEKRKEKHAKMEEEREAIRQGIRDKYGIKKKELPQEPEEDPSLDGRLGRKKKTPAEMEAEASGEGEEDENEFSMDAITSKVTALPGQIAENVSGVTEKCVVQ